MPGNTLAEQLHWAWLPALLHAPHPPGLPQMREEFTSHDVLQDHVDVARVVERAKHVHDEWMLQLGQNPRAMRLAQDKQSPKAVKPHDFHRW